MITVAYIGNGKSTNRYHLPFVLGRRDSFQCKTIYSPRIHHDKWPRIDGITYTEHLCDVMDDPEIDLVVVCTMHDLHYPYTKMALEHGKHCLCEKPFVETSEQARELFALASQRNLIVSVYHCKRYDSDFLTTQQVIRSGVLGEIYEVEMHYDYYRPYVPAMVPAHHPLYSIVYGHGCHTIDQALCFFGEPLSYRCDARQLTGKGRMNDYYEIDLHYESFKVKLAASYFRAKARPSFVAYGRKGMFVKQTRDRQEDHLKLFYMPWQEDFGRDLPEHYGVLTTYDEDGVYHEEKVPSLQGDYGRTYDDLYEAIVNGREKRISDRQILLQMEIMEAAMKGL